MADYDLLMQLKASREAKVRSVVGDTSRFEWDRDKASRLATNEKGPVPFYSNPNTRPEDRHAPQRLGDDYNLQGDPKDYRHDVPGTEWERSPNESAERKPATSEGRRPGAGFVGSERA